MWEVGVGRGESNGGKMVTTVIEQKEKKKCSYSFFFFKIYLFLDRGEGREKDKKRNINVWLLLTHPSLGTWSATQACALTGNEPATFGSQAGAQSTEPYQAVQNSAIPQENNSML